MTTPTPKNLDTVISKAQAAIADKLAQAQEKDAAERDALIDDANRMSYNLSADLAECWPDDDAPRERRHFEAGLAAAERCLSWRRQLGKGPRPFAIAHWAQGMHLLSLGRTTGAIGALQEAVGASVAHARAEGKPSAIGPDSDFLVLLNQGYLAIAQEAGRSGDGRALYDRVKAAFTEQTRTEALREDAQFGLSQLEKVAQKYMNLA